MRFDKSPSGANSIYLTMDESLGTCVYFDDRIANTGAINIVMSDDKFIELRDTLNRLYPLEDTTPAPTLPEKPGFYLTQQHQLLLRDGDGDWAAFDESGNRKHYFWDKRNASGYSVGSAGVCERLGPDAFPLVPLEDVQLTSSKG